MHAHVFQHVPFEGLGSIEHWLNAAQAQISYTRFYERGILPNPNEVDLLIIMGGPMSVNDEHEFPWLVQEKAFIKDFVQRGKPVLGICLGAQLIANAFGGKVFPNTHKEIGWFDIRPVANLPSTVFHFPNTSKVFHWHGETFSLPEGAVHLASSYACAHQAFQLNRAIGLQFHLETTPESALAMVNHCANELVAAPYIQNEATILSAVKSDYQAINALMADLLGHLMPQVSARVA
jgi:GMP synthase-like glutamine amidotransferase